MQTGTMVSVSEYLSTSYRPDCEYLDGIVLERNLGERDHSKVQAELIIYLGGLRRKLGIHVFPEQRVQVKPTRFRVPDVCVVVGDYPVEQIFTNTPFLCIEVMSKDDRMSEMKERIDDYLSFGVSFVWVLDPRRRSAEVYTPTGAHDVADGILRTSNPDITVPLSELFG